MEKRINLIPTEMAVPARAVKVAKIVTRVSTIGVIVLILVTLGFAGYFFYLSSEDKQITTHINSLKNTIVSLEKNEQKLVLAKDRLGKIEVVKNVKSVSDEVVSYRQFSNTVTSASGSAVTEANINTKGTEVSVLSETTSSLAQIFSPLANLVDYKRITLQSLGFNPSSGFIASFLFEME